MSGSAQAPVALRIDARGELHAAQPCPLTAPATAAALRAWIADTTRRLWDFTPVTVTRAALDFPPLDAQVWLAGGVTDGAAVLVAGTDARALEVIGLALLVDQEFRNEGERPVRLLVLAPAELAAQLGSHRNSLLARDLALTVQVVRAFVDDAGECLLVTEPAVVAEPSAASAAVAPPPANASEVEHLLRAAVQRMNHEVRNKAMAIRGTAECALRTRGGELNAESSQDFSAIIESVDELRRALDRFQNVKQFVASEQAGIPLIEVPTPESV